MSEQTFENLENITTETNLPAQIFIVDEMALLQDCNRSEMETSDKILRNIEYIARYGRSTQVHLILATQTPSASLVSSSLKCNMPQRFLCGKVDAQVSRMTIDSEEGDMISNLPGSCLGFCRGEKQLFQSYFIPQNYCSQSSLIQHLVEKSQQEQKETIQEVYKNRFRTMSNLLDWYQIPVGDIGYGVPYVWELDKTPHCLVCGQIGGGKTMLLNTMIAHLVDKKNVELFLTDLKGIEFNTFEKADAVKRISTTLEDTLDVTNYLIDLIKKRYEIMKSEKATIIPFDGQLKLRNNVCINKQIISNDTPVRYELKNETKVYTDKVEKLLELQDKIGRVSLPKSDVDEDVIEW